MRFYISQASASALVVRVTRLRHGLVELTFAGDDGSHSHRMPLSEALELSVLLREVATEESPCTTPTPA